MPAGGSEPTRNLRTGNGRDGGPARPWRAARRAREDRREAAETGVYRKSATIRMAQPQAPRKNPRARPQPNCPPGRRGGLPGPRARRFREVRNSELRYGAGRARAPPRAEATRVAVTNRSGFRTAHHGPRAPGRATASPVGRLGLLGSGSRYVRGQLPVRLATAHVRRCRHVLCAFASSRFRSCDRIDTTNVNDIRKITPDRTAPGRGPGARPTRVTAGLTVHRRGITRRSRYNTRLTTQY